MGSHLLRDQNSTDFCVTVGNSALKKLPISARLGIKAGAENDGF